MQAAKWGHEACGHRRLRPRWNVDGNQYDHGLRCESSHSDPSVCCTCCSLRKHDACGSTMFWGTCSTQSPTVIAAQLLMVPCNPYYIRSVRLGRISGKIASGCFLQPPAFGDQFCQVRRTTIWQRTALAQTMTAAPTRTTMTAERQCQ